MRGAHKKSFRGLLVNPHDSGEEDLRPIPPRPPCFGGKWNDEEDLSRTFAGAAAHSELRCKYCNMFLRLSYAKVFVINAAALLHNERQRAVANDLRHTVTGCSSVFSQSEVQSCTRSKQRGVQRGNWTKSLSPLGRVD